MAYTDKVSFGSNKTNKVKIYIQLHMMDMLVAYTITNNTSVTKKSLMNMKRLVDIMDDSIFKDDFAIYSRFRVLKHILELELDKKISAYEILKESSIDELSSELGSENLENIFNEVDNIYELSNDDVIFIDEYIQDRLTNSYLFRDADILEQAIQELKSNNNNIKDINSKLESVVEKLYKDIKSAKATNRFSAFDFSLSNNTALTNNIEYVVDNTISELRKPNNHLKLGIKKLNDMFQGGLENGREYLIFGLPKSFKSGTLLNIAVWICKYNKDIELNDKTKNPGVLYVTQENSVRETVQRLFYYCTGEDIKHFETDEALAILRKEITEQTGIELCIKYRPNKSISTIDLDSMVDDLETEGIECISIVHDYTKRIRSASNNPDIRLELGEVVNDLAVIAKTRNIPVLSAGQLNREGFRILENALSKNKNNISKELNASHVGESALMIENTDYAIIVHRETEVSMDKEYLTFKLIASRAKDPDVHYFAHPFENGFRLEEDFFLNTSLSLNKIGDNLEDFNPNSTRDRISAMNSNTNDRVIQNLRSPNNSDNFPEQTITF